MGGNPCRSIENGCMWQCTSTNNPVQRFWIIHDPNIQKYCGISTEIYYLKVAFLIDTTMPLGGRRDFGDSRYIGVVIPFTTSIEDYIEVGGWFVIVCRSSRMYLFDPHSFCAGCHGPGI